MNSSASGTTDFLSIVVRLLGMVMLLIGLFVGIKVIFQAWDLYKEPQNIERFADAIEQGSDLDVMLGKFTPHPKQTTVRLLPNNSYKNLKQALSHYVLHTFSMDNRRIITNGHWWSCIQRN
jgi:hypothetical protein